MFRKLRMRLRSLFRRRAVEQELDEEIRYHLERQKNAFMQQGLNQQEARRASIHEFSGVEQRKEECRDARGLWLPSLAKEGWPRHQANGPVPLIGADGVVGRGKSV